MLDPESIAQEAHRLCYGDRESEYGHPLDSGTWIGRVWGLILERIDWKPNDPVPAEVVSMMQIILKMSRELENPKRDNRVDIAGYAITVQRIIEERRRREAGLF